MRVMGLLFAAVVAIASQAHADDISMGQPAYGGSGCPAGSASAVLAPDAKTLSILFDEFIAESGGTTGRTVDRKSCGIAVPVHVPQGYSVSVIKVDYRGFVSLPRGADARMSAEYFFGGSSGPRRTDTFVGPRSQDYMLTDDLVATAVVWSRCGEDVNLRINANLTVRTNSRREQAMATVDSTDLSTRLVYHLQWKRCN